MSGVSVEADWALVLLAIPPASRLTMAINISVRMVRGLWLAFMVLLSFIFNPEWEKKWHPLHPIVYILRPSSE
ncbi:MAG: hypothetical protein K8I82_28445, partial [Anaerolineae bacterium]|nr:hypothetical protein [Anaerolineae bacterium]